MTENYFPLNVPVLLKYEGHAIVVMIQKQDRFRINACILAEDGWTYRLEKVELHMEKIPPHEIYTMNDLPLFLGYKYPSLLLANLLKRRVL
jgi:hypothetical protein